MSTPSLLNIPYLYKAGTLYSQIPESGAGDFTVTRATTPTAGRSTRINKNGFIELVADNVPRLDYPLGGAVNGCPALLVEPSAQNQCQRSEEFNNAFHFSFNLNAFGSGSVANTTATLDPYGTNVADYIQENSASSAQHSIIDIFAGNVSGTTYTWSVFAKAAERTIIQLANNAGGGGLANFNLTTGVATLTNGVSCSMQNYGNGWWRCILTYTSSATGNHNVQVRLCDASGNSTYNGTGNQGAYIFGAQLETGSVATSYIPTTTAAVTRSADVISRTSASALIGQSEGTIYAEVVLSRVNANQIISLGSTNDRIAIFFDSSTGIYALIRVGATNADYNATIPAIPATGGVYKIALAYKANDYCFAVNGVAYNPSTASRGVPANMSAVYLGASVFSTGQLNDRIRAFEVFPNRIPNTAAAGVLSLATLTAP